MKRMVVFNILVILLCTISCGDTKSGDVKTPESGRVTSSPCEAFMTEYEQFADSYVTFMQEAKANPTDMSVLSKSADMLKQAADMANKAKDCQGDASMLPRLQKVQEKLQNVVQ
ncbi:MAG: DUF6591 domain-containing protein [Candidatus Kapaibacteriota bacterium]